MMMPDEDEAAAESTTETGAESAAALPPEHIADKNQALRDWHEANPPPEGADDHTREQKLDLLKLMTDLFGETDGAVVELKGELGA